MSAWAYYNEFDPFAAQWLRELIKCGYIADGLVDERSILDVKPDDIKEFTQCHFFAGIGGWSLALRMAGVPDDMPVWTGSCPCFPKDTMVCTRRGMIPIQDVRVGDSVLTHRYRWRTVLRVGCNKNSDIVELKGQGHWGMRCTPNHPFLTDEGEWVSASDMAGRRWVNFNRVPDTQFPAFECGKRGYTFDKKCGVLRVYGNIGEKHIYLGKAKTPEEARKIRLEAIADGRINFQGADAVSVEKNEFAYFLGRWVGDGWVSGDGVFVCDSEDKADEVRQMARRAGLNGYSTVENGVFRFRCGSKALVKWLKENFGSGAREKTIPNWILGANEEYRREFCKGWFDSDGNKKGNASQISTSSKRLAVGLKTLLISLGYAPTQTKISPRSHDGKTVIQGRSVNEHAYYQTRWTDVSRSFRFGNDGGYGLVRKVIPAGTDDVYNIEVEEDNSYIADGIIVHNCQAFSIAGSQRGFSDERHLWPVFYRLIAERKPPIVFGEQVDQAVKHGWLDLVQDDLEKSGYAFGSVGLNAACIGAPHVRHRIYWGGGLKNMGYSKNFRFKRAPIGPLHDTQRREAQERQTVPTGASLDAVGDARSDGCGRGSAKSGGEGHSELQEHGQELVQGTKDVESVGSENCGMADPAGDGRMRGGESAEVQEGLPEGSGASGFLSQRLEGRPSLPYSTAAVPSAMWDGCEWRKGADGFIRPIGPFDFPLAYGVPARVGRLRGYGNAIVPQLGAVFVQEFLGAADVRAVPSGKKGV